MTDHLITPPPELVQELWDKFRKAPDASVDAAIAWTQVITFAAQWAADQELEACEQWVSDTFLHGTREANQLRAARRPKPPSLKEQALALIDACTDPEGDYLDDNALSIIRRALEALPDD